MCVRDRLPTTFNIELRLSHAEVENGAIGYRSDMWAGSLSTQRQNAIVQDEHARACTLDAH